MTKLFRTCTAIALCFSLVACEEPADQNELRFIQSIDKMETESFRLPDSLDTKLIIASYFDESNSSNCFFMYADTGKTRVFKLDFMPDSSAHKEWLEVIKYREFRSTHQPVDYVINENAINMIYIRNNGEANVPNSRSFKRSDRD